jgi:hypothetical protein
MRSPWDGFCPFMKATMFLDSFTVSSLSDPSSCVMVAEYSRRRKDSLEEAH